MGPGTVAMLGWAGKTLYDHVRGDQTYRRGAAEAGKARGFAKEMRNTQWQAAVEDMRLAGLNPALAYSQGPNAAPGGGAASGGPGSTATDPAASAMALKLQKKQMQLLDNQAQAAMAQAIKTRFEGRKVQLENVMTEGQLGVYFQYDQATQQYKMTPAARRLFASEFDARIANNARASSQLRLSRYSESEMEAISQLFSRGGVNAAGLKQYLPLLLALIRR